jgi:benzoate membrane transport protein
MKTFISSYLPAVAIGAISVVVGFFSSVAILFQAAQAAGATSEQTSSWVFAVCLGAGLTSIVFSLYYKMPILAAWSTPGAALLSTSLLNIPMSDTIGAFIFSGSLVLIAGLTGWFEKALRRIPVALASAMLAGVLVRFGLDVFVSMKTQPALVLVMLAVYCVSKKFIPRYAVILVAIVGTAMSALQGQLQLAAVSFEFAHPVWISPTFSWNVLVGVGVPLFIVTMASQNLPGVTVLRNAGYHPPISKIMTGTGLVTMLLAPFGAFSVNLAAITAAMCSGPEAHADSSKRYIASTSAGVVYLVVALLSSAIIALLTALPKELVFALGGIALFATIANSLLSAVREDFSREAAVITFLVTASGVSLLGIGAPFWGLVVGVVALIAMKPRA